MAKSKAVPAAQLSHDDYEAKDAAHTLMRAEEIRGNKDLHERAQKHVRKQFHAAARAMTSGKKGSRFTARAKLSAEKPGS